MTFVLFQPEAAGPTAQVSPRVAEQIRQLGDEIGNLRADHSELLRAAGMESTQGVGRVDILHGYIWVFVVAFAVTLITTPIMRRLAIRQGLVDRPNDPRKIHRVPIAYMGGVAVFLGLMAGVLYSYLSLAFPGLIDTHGTIHTMSDDIAPMPVPYSVVLGMFIIMLVGLFDDAANISPRLKIAGQLVAAAALAIDNVGVNVAQGVLKPIGEAVGNEDLTWTIPLVIPGILDGIEFNLMYWAGTAVIAAFVLGGTNAANLIDGLDGLLSGVTAIAVGGFLIVALTLALRDDGVRDAQRIILCLAVLGACLGFLPHNFNPANIFLGDSGSLLLGYCSVVIILTLGDTGKTHLVAAGMLIWAIPVIDTALAIVRRKLARKRMSDADDQHLHHMFKRALGVKGAVLALYGIGGTFAFLGVMLSITNAKFMYAAAFVFLAFVGVTAIKIARKRQLEEAVLKPAEGLAIHGPASPPTPDGKARASESDAPATVG